jgi:hypothetical protein
MKWCWSVAVPRALGNCQHQNGERGPGAFIFTEEEIALRVAKCMEK